MDAFVIENILHEPNGYKRLVVSPTDPDAGPEPDKVVDFRTFKRCGFVEGGFYFVDEHGICQFSGVNPNAKAKAAKGAETLAKKKSKAKRSAKKASSS